MLVLSRRLGEKIRIPQCHLTITVLRCGPEQIRLGFEGPRDLVIMREELLEEAERAQERQDEQN